MKQVLQRIHNLFSRLIMVGESYSEDQLIIFDKKVIGLLFCSAILFLGSVLTQLHGSSLGYWGIVFPEKIKDPGILLGKPRDIRSDEWLVETPFLFAQANHAPAFPVENPSLGAAKTPLLMSLPVKHFSMIFRPQLWGFFVLPLPYAFSFYWNIKIFGLILGVFFLLRLLTKNKFTLSLFGAVWVYFSGFIQWWFSTPIGLPEMIFSICGMFISIAYILYSERSLLRFCASIGLVAFNMNFLLGFYPPFQLPLLYLLAFLVGGYILEKTGIKNIRSLLKERGPWLMLPLLLTAVVLGIFYFDAKETIELVRNTVYPGSRFLLGGDMSVQQLFAGTFDYFWTQKHFPVRLGNIVEASNFFLLFPVVFLYYALLFVKGKKEKALGPSWIELSLGAYLIVFLVWMLVGFPSLLAKYSLFSMVQPTRSLVGLGIGSILLVIVFLSRRENKKVGSPVLVYGFFLVIMIFLVRGFQGFSDQLLTNWQQAGYVIGMPLLAVFLWQKQTKLIMGIVCLLLTSHLLINPVAQGINTVFQKKIVTYVTKEDKGYTWAVYGPLVAPNLLKITGARVINGVNYVPIFDILNILDPEGHQEEVYNRYAHIVFVPQPENVQEVTFRLDQADSYTVFMNPCSEKARKLGVDRIVFANIKTGSEYSCLQSIKKMKGFEVFVYKQ